ncbi:phage tail protein [Lysobacter humi (ex Lee et al. 2017)]
MSTPFLAQVLLVPFQFAPRGYASCNGQLLPINQNQALFSLLGTQYGGNGQTNFALPDMRGRTPMSYSSSVDAGWNGSIATIGERAGAESVTLAPGQVPSHAHAMQGTTAAGTSRLPGGRVPATSVSTGTAVPVYGTGPAVGLTGVGTTGPATAQPHVNMQPYTVLNFCIALQGIFPSRN